MNKLGSSIRFQIISVTILSLLVLAIVLVTIDFSQQRAVLIDTEHRVGLTLIRSVNNTINSVRAFISTLSDIAELDTRLAELADLNTNIDFIAVTDVDGSIIFHSNRDYRGITISEMANLPSDETVLKDIQGFGEVFLTSLAFESNGLLESPQFQIVIASAAEPINNKIINDVLSSILVTALFTLVTASVIIFLLQYYFVRPLEMLTKASEAIKGGDLDQQVGVTQNNEIGLLAASFNQMTAQLASLINELEARVKDRTHELEIARDQAEQASRAKSDFLSNMSHELRTPLNMVIGYTSSMLTMPQMYNNVPLPEIYQADIQLIRDSGKHLLLLINDVLDLSKVEAGKMVLNFTVVDLNVTLDDAVAISLGLVEDKPLQIRQKYLANLPKVWADKIRIRQIILNLMSNAIKYTQTGSVTLFAEMRGDHVYIAVIDTGPGIEESALSSIFDRFQQIQNNATIQGTGLGLDISQRLTELHGSEITINSTVGFGSTFAFTLPVATAEQLALEQREANNTGNTTLFEAESHQRLLAVMVAADAATRQQMHVMLEAQGIVVVDANDSEQALDLTTGLIPDFVVIDDSVAAHECQVILEGLQSDPETQSIPVIVTEGVDFQSQLVKHILPKPIEPDYVLQIVSGLRMLNN